MYIQRRESAQLLIWPVQHTAWSYDATTIDSKSVSNIEATKGT